MRVVRVLEQVSGLGAQCSDPDGRVCECHAAATSYKLCKPMRYPLFRGFGRG